MLVQEHAIDDKGRVSAGNPSLSSQRRRDITEFQLQQLYQRECTAQYRAKETQALAPDNGMDTTDMAQMVGIPLIGARIIQRLRKLNSNLHFEVAKADPSKTGIYLLKPNLKGGLEREYVCGMETELNPEFSVRIVGEDGKAKGIISGWRRALMRLIRARMISEPAAWALFGPPSRESENWARFTS